MAESKSLRLGNVFNKVESLGANTQEKTARSLALANTVSGIADTLSGKDYQPGMSGFEQALIAGARGAASGLQGKAAIEQAKGQDELNAYAKTIADYEMQTAKVEEAARKEQESITQAAPAIAAATIAFAEGKTDEQTYSATVENLVKNIMQTQGLEVVSVSKQGTDPFTYAVTVKDPETGETETAIRNVGKEFGGAVLKMDAELGKAFIASAGRLPANYFQKQEKPTGKLAELQTAQEALGRELTEPEKAKILGLGMGTGEDKTTQKRKESLGKVLDDPNKSPLLKAGKTAQQAQIAASLIVNSGLEGGFGTDVLSTLASAFGTALNLPDLTKTAATTESLRAALAPLVFSSVSNLGSGTGISNKDLDFAEKSIGSITNTAESLLRNMALAQALAEKDAAGYEVEQAWVRGDIETAERDQLLSSLRNVDVNDPDFGVAAATERYFQRYMADYQAKKTGATAPSQTQTISIDENGNIIE
jgi:hypothetical protein